MLSRQLWFNGGGTQVNDAGQKLIDGAGAETPRARELPAWAGIAVVVGAAVFMGLAIVSARAAYLGGSNVMTVLAVRFVFMAAALAVVTRLLGVPLGVPRPLVLPVLGLAISFAAASYGYIGSVAYIPVSLAAVIMYTYPLMVAVLSRLVDREPFTLVKVAAVLVAFAGIAMMLGFSFAGLDWRGVALAFLGATGYTVCIIGSSRVLRRVSFLTLTFHMSAVSALPFLAIGVASAGFAAPVTAWGWVATVGVGVTFLIGFLAFLAGVKLIGATRTAVICNLEPVLSVLAGLVLFAESFTATQALGAAIVLAGVFLLVHEDARIRRRAAPTRSRFR